MRNIGDMVGGLTLTRRLGEGPFGIVWLAYDQNRVPTAAKFLRDSFVSRRPGQAAFTRLLGSIRAYKGIDHPNIARVWGGVEDSANSALGMVSEYIDGRSLADVHLPASLQGGRERKALGTLVGWFAELSETVSWMHQNGIVHGNLKPRNVILERGESVHRIRVLDLPWSAIGLAAPAAGEPTYLAPEQLQGQPPSAASDQWTLGTMLARILSQNPNDPSLTNLPFSLVNAADQATRPHPTERFGSVAELAAVLRQVQQELVPAAGPQPSISSHPGFVAARPDVVRKARPREPTLPGGKQVDSTDGIFPAQVPLQRQGSLPPVPEARPLALGDEVTNAGEIEGALEEPALDFSAIGSQDLGGPEPEFGQNQQQNWNAPPDDQEPAGDRVGPFGMALGILLIAALGAAVAYGLWRTDPDNDPRPPKKVSVDAGPAGLVAPPPVQKTSADAGPAAPPPVVTPPPPPAKPAAKKPTRATKPKSKPKSKPKTKRPTRPQKPDLDPALDSALEKLNQLEPASEPKAEPKPEEPAPEETAPEEEPPPEKEAPIDDEPPVDVPPEKPTVKLPEVEEAPAPDMEKVSDDDEEEGL